MTVQIALKLPDELASELDRLVQEGSFESRSQALRAGLQTILAAYARHEIDQRYRDAIARFPETPQEITEARKLAIESINDEPWERWW